MTFVILMVTTMMILAELGFNIATILAGTSVVALTVAIGVQSIVKDLVSGVFMLIEDQLGIGDYVDMEQASGTVEAVGLRITSCATTTATSGTSVTAKCSGSATSARAAGGRPRRSTTCVVTPPERRAMAATSASHPR